MSLMVEDPVAELVLELADPIFSREQCSPGILCMRWRAAPPIELPQAFVGSAPDFLDFYTHLHVIWQ